MENQRVESQYYRLYIILIYYASILASIPLFLHSCRFGPLDTVTVHSADVHSWTSPSPRPPVPPSLRPLLPLSLRSQQAHAPTSNRHSSAASTHRASGSSTFSTSVARRICKDQACEYGLSSMQTYMKNKGFQLGQPVKRPSQNSIPSFTPSSVVRRGPLLHP